MKADLRIAVFSIVLLASACTSKTDPAVPTAPPAGAPAKPETAMPKAASVDQAPASAVAPAAAPAPALSDLGKVLGSIKDAGTAGAAKGQLDALVQQLQTAKNAAPAAGAKEALGAIGKVAGDAMGKLGISPDAAKQVATLLENPAIKAVIGPTLEKLQALLK